MKRISRFFTIKYWKDYIRLKHILTCIENAKRHFIKDRNEPHLILYGMCAYLGIYLSNTHFNYGKIKDIIPVFTPQFFNSNKNAYDHWWDIHDIQSRIKAFDKLINHYENLIKEL